MRFKRCLTEPGQVHWVFLDFCGGWESNVPSYSLSYLIARSNQCKPMGLRFGELWLTSITERVHLFAIKRFLNVSTRTPSALVYGEIGRYPLYVNTYTRCIKYWLDLVRMPDNRLPSKSYKMLYDLHCKNKNNWGFYVCFTLYRYGFGLVWKTRESVTRKVFCASLDSD